MIGGAAAEVCEMAAGYLSSLFGGRKGGRAGDATGPTVPGADRGLLHTVASPDASQPKGIIGVAHAKVAAATEEHLSEAAVRQLKARQAVLEEQRRTAEAAGALNQTILNEQAKTAEAVHRLDRAIRGETQAPPAAAVSQPARTSAQPPLQPHISDENIEQLALQLLMEGVVTEQQWQPYREAYSQKLPPFVVTEIGERLRQLWRIAGHSG